jgi:hypothetical protein
VIFGSEIGCPAAPSALLNLGDREAAVSAFGLELNLVAARNALRKD